MSSKKRTYGNPTLLSHKSDFALKLSFNQILRLYSIIMTFIAYYIVTPHLVFAQL